MARTLRLGTGGFRPVDLNWNRNRETRPLPLNRMKADLSPMVLDDALGDGHSKPMAADLTMREKGFK